MSRSRRNTSCFIFATTEPDKVIGTIRPGPTITLPAVPPEPLIAYLELLCRQET
jgi:DNA polymerase-3 subunit gamma/tau